MVICHDHANTELVCARHAFHASHAVIHGENDVRAAVFFGERVDHHGGKAVPHRHAVRNEPGHFLRPEPEKPQSLISHRARCCPVAVIVADNGNRFPFLKSVREHRGGFRGVRERGGRNQSGEPRIHFAFPDNPPPGKHLSERTGETFRLQPCGGGRIVVSGNKAGLHSVFSLNP